jgi:hypothetical protein
MLKNMKQKLGGKKPAKDSTDAGAGRAGAAAGTRGGASGTANTRTNSKDRNYAGGAGAAGAGTLPAHHLKPHPDPCLPRRAEVRWSWEVVFQLISMSAPRSNHPLLQRRLGRRKWLSEASGRRQALCT